MNVYGKSEICIFQIYRTVSRFIINKSEFD